MTRDCNKEENPIKYRVLLSDEDSTQIRGGISLSVPKSIEDKYDSISWYLPDSELPINDNPITHTFDDNGDKDVKVSLFKKGVFFEKIGDNLLKFENDSVEYYGLQSFSPLDSILYIYFDDVLVSTLDGTKLEWQSAQYDDTTIWVSMPNFIYKSVEFGIILEYSDKPTIFPSDSSGDIEINFSVIIIATDINEGVRKVTLRSNKLDIQDEYHRIIPIDIDTYTIDELISADLPQGLSIVPETKLIWIDKWQEFISRLVSPPKKPEDIHNYMAYKLLENSLIAKLVVYDAFMKSAQGAMVLMMQTASGATPEYKSEYESHSESDIDTGHGQEKMIETGPAKVEWYDVANSIDAFFKNGAGEDGTSVFDILRRQICALAARLRVRLWICPREKAPTIIPRLTRVAPSIVRRHYFPTHNKHHK